METARTARPSHVQCVLRYLNVFHVEGGDGGQVDDAGCGFRSYCRCYDAVTEANVGVMMLFANAVSHDAI